LKKSKLSLKLSKVLPIHNYNNFPYSAIGKVLIYESSIPTIGTGFFIAPNLFLTCYHTFKKYIYIDKEKKQMLRPIFVLPNKQK
jgi:V8-like Glu-specific endopeptidase